MMADIISSPSQAISVWSEWHKVLLALPWSICVGLKTNGKRHDTMDRFILASQCDVVLSATIVLLSR